MFDLKYDPSTKVFKIQMDDVYKEGKYDIYQVAQIIHNYIIAKMEMEANISN